MAATGPAPVQMQPMSLMYPAPVMAQPVPATQSVTQTSVTVNAAAASGPLIRNWHTGLFACFEDVGDSVYGMLCPLCLASRISTRMDEHCCAPCCVPCWLLAMRAFLRGKFKIQGTLCGDCITICCCPPCALCQLSREVGYIHKQIKEKKFQGVV